MAEQTSTGTVQPPHEGGAGFPPFKTESFPSQFFWLAITFAALFVVLWRVSGPRISGVISERRHKIAGDLETAQKHRDDAKAAQSGYEAALTAARAKSMALAEESRKQVSAEIESAKAAADAQAHEATAKAETRIAVLRSESRGHMQRAAQEAASAIVAKLIGENVLADDAAAAVRAVQGN